MPNQNLLDYINFKLKNGASNEEIKKNLLEAKWQEGDIDNAFEYINKQTSQEAKNSGFGKIIFVLIIFLLLSASAFAAYKYVYLQNKILKEEANNQNNISTTTIPSVENNILATSSNEIIATTSNTVIKNTNKNTLDYSQFNPNNLSNCIVSSGGFSFNMMQGDIKTKDIVNIFVKINSLQNNICNLSIKYSFGPYNRDISCKLSTEDRKRLSDFFSSTINNNPPKNDVLKTMIQSGYCSWVN